jgi:dCTP deaminase
MEHEMIGSPQLVQELRKGNAGEAAFISIIPAPDYDGVEGASIDLHLGRWFSLPHQSRNTHYDFSEKSNKEVSAKEYFTDFDGQFVLHPGRFVLAITLEWIRLPSNRAAYVTGKSNIGRRGLVIETAPGVHPHFNGCLTLEVANLGEVPLVISPGMKICQLFVHETCECPLPKKGQFSSQIKPTFGKNN